MKDLISLKTSTNEEVERTLNHQINTEAHALSMSTWWEEQGFDFSSGFVAKQPKGYITQPFKYGW